jgi:hypothetical protein
MDSNDLVLILKVQADQGAKIDDLSNKLNNLNKSSKDTSEGFSLMDTKAGSFFKSFTDGVSKGVASLKTFGGAMAATGIGLLVIAIAGLVNYFKNTEEGANKLSEGMAALGAVVKAGPIVVFDALKTVVAALLLPMETIVNIWKNAAKVLIGKESVSDAIQNVSKDLKEHIQTIKDDAIATVNATKTAIDRTKEAIQIQKMKDELEEKTRDNLLKTQKLESQISQDKADAAAEQDVNATEKKKLFNDALQKEHDLYLINESAAEDRLKIAQAEIANVDKPSREMLEELAEATANLEAVKTNYTQSTVRLNKQVTASDKAEAAEQQKIADEIAKAKEDALEASLTGQMKEQAALDFKYKEDQEAAKNNNKLLSDLNDKYIADSLALQKKYDDEQIKKDKETADKLYEQKQRDDKKALDDHKKALDDHKAIQDQLAKLNTKDQTTAIGKLTAQYNQERNSFKQLCDDKHATAQELAEGMQAINEAEANAKKKLRQVELEDYLAQAGSILQTASDLAGKSTVLGKATAIAGIIANAAQAEIKTFVGYADMPIIGEILAIAQAAMIGLSAAKSISQVEAVKAPAAQHLENGGLVGGNSYSGDKISLMGNTGEIMINNRATANPLIAQQALMLNNGQLIQHNSITEERVAEIVRQGIKSVPVVASQYRLDWTDQRVKASQGHFTV